ncbi:AMIN-like domain-containing (lipo)protein [Sanguibacter suaedae]|uniref:AMIN-like domain-containing protein n=1 Tax=Sanguibacter suaedae TaxID=2795737 RepID=A0A934I3C0_9MICO|nr:hypothetical protein [Sanguibacter suaedae]MBI9114468.1 hypothetical protein [Sanguibacter suaedae]
MRLVGAGTIGLLLLAGCSADPEPVSTTTPSSTVTDTETSEPVPTSTSSAPMPDAATTAPPDTADDEPADEMPFPANTLPDTAEASAGAALTVVDVRTGRHDGFDRVVYEMEGPGTPGWYVEYVDQAEQAGSGKVLDLAGDGTLAVRISGSGYPMDSGADPFSHDGPVEGEGTVVVTEARGWSVFEGITDAFVGLTEAGHPFRVHLLEDPVRVVVDVAHTTG